MKTTQTNAPESSGFQWPPSGRPCVHGWTLGLVLLLTLFPLNWRCLAAAAINAIPDRVAYESPNPKPAIVRLSGISDVKSIIAEAADEALIPELSVSYTSGTTGTLTFTTAADKTGETTVTLTLTDTVNVTSEKTFKITVRPINHAPSFTLTKRIFQFTQSSEIQTYASENAIAKDVSPGKNADGVADSGQTTSFVLTPANAAASAAFSTKPTIDSELKVHFALKANVSGLFPVSVVVKDNGSTANGGKNTSPAQLIYIAVAPNIQDTITISPTETTSPAKRTTDVTLTVTSLLRANVQVSVKSVDKEWLTATIRGPGTKRTLTLTPAETQTSAATAKVTLHCDDGIIAVDQEFTFNLTPLPIITGFDSLNAMKVGDLAQTSTFTVTGDGSSNPIKASAALTGGSFATVAVTGVSPDFTVTVTPKKKGSGSVVLTVVQGLATVTKTVNLSVAAAAPAFARATTFSRYEETPGNPLEIKVAQGSVALNAAMFTATSQNTDVVTIPENPITFAGDTLKLTVSLKKDANTQSSGDCPIVITIDDEVADPVSTTIKLKVLPVNDPPTFTVAKSSMTATRFLAAQTVDDVLTGIERGPTDEQKQTWKASITPQDASAAARLFTRLPAFKVGSAADKASLTFTAGTNSGSATFDVVVTDTGGKANQGSDTSETATLTITVPSNPFPPLAGTYNGLFLDSGKDSAKSGFVTLTTTASGAFTGKIMSAGATNTFAGQFAIQNPADPDVAVADDVTVGKTTLSLTDLELDLDPDGTETIAGSVVNESETAPWTTSLDLVRSIVGTTTLMPDGAVGSFTMAIPGADAPANGPVGYGAATVTVTTGGVLTFAGTLADGTPVRQQVGLSKYAEWPLYVPLYSKGTKGMLAGWITFNDVDPKDPMADSPLIWVKKPVAGDTYYASGWNALTVQPLASAYDPWQAWPCTDGTVVLDDGNLDEALSIDVTVDYYLLTPKTPLTAHSLSATVDPFTGILSGSFVDSSKTRNISGVLLQAVNRFVGSFLGDDEAGSFALTYAGVPAITEEPSNTVTEVGESATFTVEATPADTATFQWYKNGEALDGKTAASLTLDPVGEADLGDYSVVVSTPVGSVTSKLVCLALITTQPSGQTVAEGAINVSFTVVATTGENGPPISYQWKKGVVALEDGENISGAQTATLTLASVAEGDAGDYTVDIIVGGDPTSSAEATLIVTTE
ncbi:MAG: immunoglobulin domain-containing protein [Verrucomicrobiia bacterium]